MVNVPPLVWSGVSLRWPLGGEGHQLLGLRAELGDGLGVGVPDDRNDQPAFRRHRDADVDPVVGQHDAARVAAVGDVDVLVLAQRHRAGPDQQVVDADLRPATRTGELGVQRRAQVHQGLRVGDLGHLEERGHPPARGQAAGDHPANLADRRVVRAAHLVCGR